MANKVNCCQMSLHESDSELFTQILHDYALHQQTLETVQYAKYLGITITENMDWGQHISDHLRFICLSLAGPTVSQLEGFFSSDYL